MDTPGEHPPIPLAEVAVRIGTVAGRHFNVDCQPGDTQTWNVSFGDDTPFVPDTPIRVILTPNNHPTSFAVPNITENAAIVGVVQQLDHSGFQLRARNSGCATGTAGFNWMAVQPTPGTVQETVDFCRIGVIPPRRFHPDCRPGDRSTWQVRFSPELNVIDDATIIALLTPTNLNVMGHSPAVVGIAQEVSKGGISISARNSDSGPSGDCSFYLAALCNGPRRSVRMWMASGDVSPQSFEPDDRPGDWRAWHVYFPRPFLSPPIVLLTATDNGVPPIDIEFGYIAHAVGVAQNVTSYGFTLASRNSGCIEGSVGFNWIAIGMIESA